jgi:uncharacterized protein involved in response to NO
MLKKINSLSLLSYPFRIFFLLCGIYAIAIIYAWMGILLGQWALPLGWTPLYWHSHEMIFGVVTAAICGFLLTAICNWTGAKPLLGIRLCALASVWLLGRLAMWFGRYLPAELVMLIDGIFLPIFASYVAYILISSGSQRNLLLAAALGLLALSNLAMHWGFYTQAIYWLWAGETLALGLITLIMVIIAGRVIPLFTVNGLRGQGYDVNKIKNLPALNTLAILSTAVLIPLTFITQYPLLVGVGALIAAAINAIRLAQWAGLHTRREPLLWVLHLGYAWLVVALLCKGLVACGLPLAPSVAQHALGLGAMSTLILGMMARVSLGHTGRPLVLPRFGVVIFIAITGAAIARTWVALGWFDFRVGLLVTATGWIIAFAMFVILYAPILTSPRINN